MSQQDFVIAKKKSFDSISSIRYELTSLSDKYFYKIIEKDYKFFNFIKMENYSKSITLEDLVKFYNDVFIDPNLKMTVYVYFINPKMYSKNVKEEEMHLMTEADYEEL
jgi:hypothetical protein